MGDCPALIRRRGLPEIPQASAPLEAASDMIYALVPKLCCTRSSRKPFDDDMWCRRLRHDPYCDFAVVATPLARETDCDVSPACVTCRHVPSIVRGVSNPTIPSS